MPITLFIPELLENIISYHKEDPKTLFKCALVSKSWCDTVIPFLWKNPFRFCYSTSQHKIIKVYLKLLSKEFLNKFDLNQIICLNPLPSYNYLSFLQELVYITLYESLINLLKKELSYKTISASTTASTTASTASSTATSTTASTTASTAASTTASTTARECLPPAPCVAPRPCAHLRWLQIPAESAPIRR